MVSRYLEVRARCGSLISKVRDICGSLISEVRARCGSMDRVKSVTTLQKMSKVPRNPKKP